ncbi:hypothetical protein [Aeoliella sp.]|uniref:hypothetical protein n=1 Tax=Aeoliella sp. TaxID=2795800 RepID=UPI003CCC3522
MLAIHTGTYITLLVGLMLLFIVFEVRAWRRRVRRITSSRDELSFDEWLKLSRLESLDSQHRQLVQQVLEIASDCYMLPPTCLRMEDGFWDELGLDNWLSNGDDALETLQERLPDELNIAWDKDWATIGDVIRGVVAAPS